MFVIKITDALLKLLYFITAIHSVYVQNHILQILQKSSCFVQLVQLSPNLLQLSKQKNIKFIY